MKTEGCHVIADVWVEEYPEDISLFLDDISKSIDLSGLTIVSTKTHFFNDAAFTAVFILAESHFSIHTFPERNFMSLDCYTCGEKGKPLFAVSNVLDYLEVKRSDIKVICRGKF